MKSRTKSNTKNRKAPVTSATAMNVGDQMRGRGGLYYVIKQGKSKRWQKVPKAKKSRR